MAHARKLAAIMAVDVVGYSRLMGEDEAGTAAAVRARREAAAPIVGEKGGRIVKTMGDGLLVEFPSVVAAVECAILIQKMMVEQNEGVDEGRRIIYRIGVHIGDVLIDGDDILGDGVNIAARLEGICEPGGVSLSSDAYRQVEGRVEADFADLGEKSLKNIVRPLRVYGWRLDGAPAAAPEPYGPPPLSMVVLPFANFGGGPEHDYFVDGVTESLTTDLSRMRGAFVIGRSTAFTFKGKAVDAKQIGPELNVRYVLEGSVQRGGGRMRVNVQLIDAVSGAHLWAERFDKPIADLFDMQDEIVARLANQLQTELIEIEARRSQHAPNPTALDLEFQGFALVMRGTNPQSLDAARALFERALALDPESASSLIGSALVDTIVCAGSLTDDPAPLAARAEAALTKALMIAPGAAFAHQVMGVLLCATRRAARGLEELERSLALDPNLAASHAYIGFAKIYLGRAEETERHVAEALRLSPRDANAYVWLMHVGLSKLHLGEYDEALPWFRRSLDANRNAPWAYFFAAAALAHQGRLDEARREVAAGLAIDPKFTLSRLRAGHESDNPAYLAQGERVIEGLRLAGVPAQ